MAIIKQIPKKLLVHSVKYQPLIGNDGWNNEYGEEITINHVRVVPITSMNRSSNSEGKQANHTVIIDRVNSSYFPDDAKAGDKITFRGMGREATLVKYPSAFDSEPHHLAIEVI
ncbi:putative minor capsid protein [Virgibacillus sp. Bac332]|uniref:putative minor capsid protein n=1 Tax=Virgibacillus sp. Bac332 TaxID=2419842 RepID=UPI000EF5284E|nr:putative minor capsid protein [Virgibacillus sp. Bac332]